MRVCLTAKATVWQKRDSSGKHWQCTRRGVWECVCETRRRNATNPLTASPSVCVCKTDRRNAINPAPSRVGVCV
jgi:hypothetical protein